MTFDDPERILVVTLRRLGDVLFTTPLTRSLKRAWPNAAIDALVFAGTEGILAGNPDLHSVVTMPPRPSVSETLALLGRLWRHYDLALSTHSGDRPTLFAWAAGRRSAGFVDPEKLAVHVKRLALDVSVPVAPALHRVPETLRLAQALGVAPIAELVAPSCGTRAPPDQGGRQRMTRRYAVVHVAPKFRYKQWTEEGWRGLAAGLSARGLAVVATGGPDPEERRYLDAVWAARPEVERLDGTLSWPELAAVLRDATVYIGPDTAVTHLAAATGAPTVALYGPTDPRLWGPWPVDGTDPPWVAVGTIQARRNVWLVQNPLPCLPCQQEGCLRRLDSHSQCLDELSVGQVLAAVDAALATPVQRRHGSAPA